MNNKLIEVLTLGVVWGALLIGCDMSHSCGNTQDKIRQGIEQKISVVPAVLQRGELKEFCANLTDLVTTLSNRQLECQYYKKAIERVFSCDADVLPIKGQYWYVRRVDKLWGEIAGSWLSGGATRSDIWDARVWDLKWRRRQLERLRAEYEEIKPQLRMKPIPESIYKKALQLYGILQSIESNYISQTANYERFYWDEAEKMPPIQLAEIRHKLESVLGRPLRSLQQIQKDRWRRSELFQISQTNDVPILHQIIGD